MLEIFAGSAILSSIAKQYGMQGSLAVDKVQKPGARASVIRLDLTREVDCALVDKWLESDMLLWIHLAPVCGTASRARDIQCSPNDPKPLRSCERPDGLPHLEGSDLRRVEIANKLFEFACRILAKATQRGILATIENPKNSHFWNTTFFLSLWKQFELFCSDFQVCMYGGSRAKWTRFVANFASIQELSIECDGSHAHEPWRFAVDRAGQRVWATSLESQYPRKLCIAVTHVILQVAQCSGLQLLPQTVHELAQHPLSRTQQAMISTGGQPYRKKIPPMVPDFDAVATAFVKAPGEVPYNLLAKTDKELTLTSPSLQELIVPAKSRLLRFYTASNSNSEGGEPQESEASECLVHGFPFRAVFGLPWSPENFIQKACKLGHPGLADMGVPEDLDIALDRHMQWTDEQLVKYRSDWCRHWLKRASQLEVKEKADRDKRPPHVRENTCNKRLLLTLEMLESIQYPDLEVLKLLREGATLAGEVESCDIFERQFKPCLLTVEQLEAGAARRNQAIMAMTASSGDADLDKRLLAETLEEVERGWARGPYKLAELPPGSVISRRFPLAQSNKVRLIDDFSVSGVNDSCVIHSKINLHMIDTLGATVRKYFKVCRERGFDSSLLGKTFDLKSAYRQAPICSEHLKFSYFSVYNHCKGEAEIYQLMTLPFWCDTFCICLS